MIVYQGPSMLDGSPIVAIVTGLDRASPNAKTGAMAQVYILRSDVHPIDANKSGADAAICGACPHMGQGGRERSCYVTLGHGPSTVFKAFQRGYYGAPVSTDHAALALAGIKVRLGTYGDPAAVPMRIWRAILAFVQGQTAYTHQWRAFPELAEVAMASCDTEADRVHAKALGFRTFRVRTEAEPVAKGEGICPASAEMGKATQCHDCMLCGGQSGRGRADIVIIAHSSNAKHFEVARRRAA